MSANRIPLLPRVYLKRKNSTHGMLDKDVPGVLPLKKLLALPLCDGCVACDTGICNQSARATTRFERQPAFQSAGTTSNRRFCVTRQGLELFSKLGTH